MMSVEEPIDQPSPMNGRQPCSDKPRSTLPGFRTGKWWKMGLAIIGYGCFALLIIGTFLTDDSLRDRLVTLGTFIVLFVPMYLITNNAWGIRDRLLGAKRNVLGLRLLLIVGAIFLGIIGGMYLDGFYSPVYKVQRAQQRTAEAKLAAARENEDAARKAEEEFLRKKREAQAQHAREEKAGAQAEAAAERERTREHERVQAAATAEEHAAAQAAQEHEHEARATTRKTEAQVALANARAKAEDLVDQATQNPLKLEETWVETDEFGIRYICGYVHNTARRRYEEVQIEFNLYDQQGVQIGETFDNTMNLAPGRTWKFKAMVRLDEDDVQYELTDLWGNQRGGLADLLF